MASPFLILACLALLAFPLAAAAASQPPALSRLHSAWSFSANSSLPILLSASRSYSWKFYTPRLDPSLRFLVVLSTRFNTTVVWTANRNHPVSPRATLSLGSDGKLLLKDSDGFVAWSTENSSGIKMALMNDTGNLLMLSGNDTARDVVWQSFDHPTDTMVVGQRLITGTTATASVSWDSFAEGNFSLKAEPGGGVLYASLNGEAHVPYQLLNYIVQDNTLHGALHSVCNRTDVLYAADGSSVALVQEEMTPQCQAANAGIQIHAVQFSTRQTGDGYRFLKLDPDGDLRAYFQSAQTGQIVDNEFFGGYFDSLCKLPTYCGSYGLCSGVKNCSCPNGVDFRPVNPSDLRQGCALLHPLNCTNATAVSYQQLRVLQGVDYYANTYTIQRRTTTEECQASCLSDCSCVAAFYKNSSGVCYHYGSIATMEYNSDPTVTAFLKVVGSPPRPKRNNARLIVGLSVGGSGFLICLVLVIGLIIRHHLMAAASEDDAFLEALPGLPPRFSYKELQAATNNFKTNLGTGGSGSVFQGTLRDNTTVAVKQLQLAEAQSSKQFRAEVATLGNINHINLVQLRGFCAEASHRLLIYEYMSNGSLDRWIFQDNTGQRRWLSCEARYKIAVDTARGLAFLHDESRDAVVHLDVKPQNILLDENFNAKLADFGLSKLLDRAQSRTVTAMRGTPGYMAPEWFLNLPVTDKSDVFSYGMVLLELIGGRKNLVLSVATEEWYFPAWAVQHAEAGKVMEVVDKQLMQGSETWESAEVEKVERLIKLAFWCIQDDPSTRPAMSTVLLMLEGHVEVPDPPLDLSYGLRARRKSPLPPDAAAAASGRLSQLSWLQSPL